LRVPPASQPSEDTRDARVVRSRAAILRATAELLIESGAGGVTIERIAERSRVAKTTIYRHWKTRPQLIFDAFRSLFAPAPGALPDGPVREVLTALLWQLVVGVTASGWAPAVPALVDASDREPELRQLIHDFIAARMERSREVLRAAIARGELRQDLDVEVAVDLLIGPIFYRRLVSRDALDRAFVTRLVDEFLRGAGGHARAP
jgi:AcrR family transcriptional regulator